MRSMPAVLVAVCMLAGLLQSCKHDPVAPPNPPDTTTHPDTTRHPDTTHRTLSITYDSLSSVIHKKVVFTVSAKPVAFPKVYTIAWTIDTFHFSRVRLDTVSFTFGDSGTHSVRAVYIDSTGSRRDSTATAIYIKDTTRKPTNPGDTTSHNFIWHEYSISTESTLNNVWVFGPNDIWTSGTAMYHFDGTSWNQVQWGGLTGGTMFGLPDGTIWMGYADIVEHFYPTTKKADIYRGSVFGGGFITSSWGTSSHDMYFAGKYGLILHFDGTNWRRDSTPTTKDLYSIWGTSNKDIWAAGYNFNTGVSELLHFDGMTWSEDILSSSGLVQRWGIHSVFACDSTPGHTFAAVAGWTVFTQTDHGVWRSDSGFVPNDVGGRIFMGIYGNGANDLLGVGDYGLVTHWSGHSWKRYDQFLSVGDNGYFARGACTKDNTACIVGTKDGSSWILLGQR